jgi:hypothetical protein
MIDASAYQNDERIPESIRSLDFEPLVVKLLEEQKAQSVDEAWFAVRELARFYTLLLKYPQRRLCPSRFVDKVWHAHILDTIYYRRDCQNVFGRYLDHFPYFGLRGQQDSKDLIAAFVAMREYYNETFGEDIVKEPIPTHLCGDPCFDGRTESNVCDWEFGAPYDGELPPRPTLASYQEFIAGQ